MREHQEEKRRLELRIKSTEALPVEESYDRSPEPTGAIGASQTCKDKLAEEAEYLQKLAEARKEQAQERRRLAEKVAARDRAGIDDEVSAGSGEEVDSDKENANSQRHCRRLPDVPFTGESVNAAMLLEIPFTDKVKPKPKLSSEGRASKMRTSESRPGRPAQGTELRPPVPPKLVHQKWVKPWLSSLAISLVVWNKVSWLTFTRLAVPPVRRDPEGFRATQRRAHQVDLSSQESDPAGRELLQWLAEEGAEVSYALDVKSDPVLGRELVVLEDVEEGEELIKVPPELCIPADEDEEMLEFGEDIQLAMAILKVWHSEFWEAYRAVWPKECILKEILPVHWQVSRFQDFPKMPRLQDQVHSRRQLLEKVAKKKDLDLDRLTLAFDLVSTRAVGASINACALIPGVDLANHSPKANADLSVAGNPGVRSGRATVLGHGKIWEHGSAGLVAARDLSAGEVVRISYGNYPNQRFLLDYGFTLGEENPLGDEEKELLCRLHGVEVNPAHTGGVDSNRVGTQDFVEIKGYTWSCFRDTCPVVEIRQLRSIRTEFRARKVAAHAKQA
eukprot:symbB.v1.2.021723.t1/scaffold1894.1/size98026/2